MRRAFLAVIVAALVLPAVAGAQATNTIGGPLVTTTGETGPIVSSPAPSDPNALSIPADNTKPPPGHVRSGDEVTAIAGALPDVQKARKKYPGSYSTAYEKGGDRWQVSYFSDDGKRTEIAQVTILDSTGQVVEHYTGYKVPWTMARGYAGAFGRKVNEPWIWIPLCFLFVLPFVDPRRLLRWFHLDLLALSAFSVSIAFFNNADIAASVPVAYPPMAYLMVRMLVVALRRRDRPAKEPGSGAIRLLVPASWLLVGIVFLLGFRIALNLTNSNVIDVGYSGVIGADHIVHGEKLYGNFPGDDPRGDTYGPVAYEAYIPFESIFPWHGTWDDLPAAHAAAIVFDLLAVAMMFLLGRMVRGPDLGIALAYGWVSFPFTLFASNTNTNDALVTVCILLALLLAGRPLWRGAAGAVAGLTKFAPLALAPVLMTHRLPDGRRGRVRAMGLFAIGFVAAIAVFAVPVMVNENLSTFWHRTIGYQNERGAPFSIWGLYGLDTLRKVWEAVAVLMAVGLAFVPRRRDLAGLAAACAAILIAFELTLSYWFYLYIVWFFPLILIAALARQPEEA